ncbi:cyclic pyranopterin monophosphate synthase MoaC [Longirhabdus pacifica]|uniref:cyclic pyranopterin monophosphate synthase MoaC n=1 Tax=Longirhabdus pacifica TaxID=2305227 RepID=UPI0010087C8B|nr:cyclic pyranopterin monophosphate synthase MoaC [Longirhabdus pacifica]
MTNSFTHFNEQGRAVMVDITDKAITHRIATAQATIRMQPTTFEAIKENKMAKGDVLAVAQVAGVMAVKKTSDLIPMCHPLPISGVDIQFSFSEETTLTVEVEVKTTGRTGVEMEALTAASATALTVYDMCKAMDKGMVIQHICLLSKTGGKSGDYVREDYQNDNE